jgi:hypothetical protein
MCLSLRRSQAQPDYCGLRAGRDKMVMMIMMMVVAVVVVVVVVESDVGSEIRNKRRKKRIRGRVVVQRVPLLAPETKMRMKNF